MLAHGHEQHSLIRVDCYTRHDDSHNLQQPNITEPQHITNMLVVPRQQGYRLLKYPWHHITDHIARLPAMTNACFLLNSRNDLITFAGAERPALRRLVGRIQLLYIAEDGHITPFVDDSVRDILGGKSFLLMSIDMWTTS